MYCGGENIFGILNLEALLRAFKEYVIIGHDLQNSVTI
jgi:hypothetical protein